MHYAYNKSLFVLNEVYHRFKIEKFYGVVETWGKQYETLILTYLLL